MRIQRRLAPKISITGIGLQWWCLQSILRTPLSDRRNTNNYMVDRETPSLFRNYQYLRSVS